MTKKFLDIDVCEIVDDGEPYFVFKLRVPHFPTVELIDFLNHPYDYSKIPAMDYFMEGFREALSMFPSVSDKKRELFLQQALYKFESNEKSDNE